MSSLIIIAGGSGAGKSTLADSLSMKLQSSVQLIHLDDYQKNPEDMPLYAGMKNWEHPTSIRFDELYHHLTLLKRGLQVQCTTKHSPMYDGTTPVQTTLSPRPILILEGYLSLWDKRIRDMADYTIFLRLRAPLRLKRRQKPVDPTYVKYVLLPMHKRYVAPTARFADMVITTANHSAEEVCHMVLMKFYEKKFV